MQDLGSSVFHIQGSVFCLTTTAMHTAQQHNTQTILIFFCVYFYTTNEWKHIHIASSILLIITADQKRTFLTENVGTKSPRCQIAALIVVVIATATAAADIHPFQYSQ